MGKATRWLKGLLGMKKGKEQFDNSTTSSSVVPEKKEKKRWSFTKSGKGDVDNDYFLRSYVAEKENEQNKHAIAVAAATAAAADAAVAVVRLRSNGSGRLYCGSMEWWAALKIQSFFRGYLARKALRALKGLVKIQALVRGYLIRKRAAATLYSMQALMRAQVAVTSQRARRSIGKESSTLQSEIHHARKYVHRLDETRSEFQTRRVAASYRTSLNEFGFDESIKNVEIDNYDKPRLSSRRRAATTMSECGEELRYPYLVPGRISFAECRNPQWYFDVDECKFSTAHSTPRIANCCMLHNAPATPVKSVNGDTFIRPCPNSPNYMANTKSSKAKLRSHSAPKQRPEFKKRLSVDEIMAARNSTRSQTQELSLVNKVMEGYCVNWENQKENLRAN